MARAVSHGRGRPERGRNPGSLFFPAGAKVYDRNRPSRKAYLLERGLIRLSCEHEAIFAYLTPGCFFGEQCVLGQVAPSQEATSLSPATVSAFRKTELLNRLQSDRRFALRFIKSLAFRMEQYEQAIRDFVAEGAERRLARWLLRIAPCPATSGWVRLPIDPSNPELSRMVGTTRPRISRFMRHFQESGWVRREHGLWIHREGLREFLKLAKRP